MLSHVSLSLQTINEPADGQNWVLYEVPTSKTSRPFPSKHTTPLIYDPIRTSFPPPPYLDVQSAMLLISTILSVVRLKYLHVSQIF